jgi:adenosylcobinamide-GDP ribazoletransferase
MRTLILALQFLTRLPTPQVKNFSQDELPGSAPWFPLVGLLVGACIAVPIIIFGKIESWLGALGGTIMWLWITGALHLDGLADLVDALGASHRDRQRFLEVMRDPHVGTFGVIAVVITITSKLVLFQIWAAHDLAYWIALPLICAWSRLGAIAWSAWLPPLSTGTGDAFAWATDKRLIAIIAAVLLVLTAWLSPALVIMPLILYAWWAFLKSRLGGMTGDCLGAGIEFSETCALLLVAAIHITFPAVF